MVSQVPDPGYIPASTYLLYIEPVLNDFRFTKYIENKALYDRNLARVKTPNTWLRKIDTIYYDKEYNAVALTDKVLYEFIAAEKQVILKASVESGGGSNIRVFSKRDNIYWDDSTKLDCELLKSFPDFVLQEWIRQHEYFAQFNPSSNNTVRILTYRSVLTNEVHVLHSLLRIGEKGTLLDHDNLGGIVVGISEDGELNSFGTNINGFRFASSNGISLAKNSEVPFIEEIRKIAKDVARQVFYGRFLAMDFTIDGSGQPLLLDINCHSNGTCQYQMNNGPLFGAFTKEILDHCMYKEARFTKTY
jgi:hypothetical protein